MQSLEEVGREADAVRTEIEQLYVRGLAASSPADRRNLASLAEEWDRIGASHVASRLLTALRAADANAPEAPRALLSAHTSVAVFERVVSLETAVEAWSAHIQALRALEAGDGEDEDGEDGGSEGNGETSAEAPAAPAEKAAPKPAAAAPPIEDPKGLLALVDELSRAVEDLVRTGLTSATDSTRAKLDASFKEASRRKLTRLGVVLRNINDDVNRFLAHDEAFSIRRFALMLHRAWILSRAIAKGIREKNDRLVASLMGATSAAAAPRPAASIEVVTLGVFKRILAAAYTFDFRLRVVGAKDADLVGRSLVYSLVFPRKPDVPVSRLPAEANLQLPQPQKFLPKVFCQGKQLRVTDCAVALDDRGSGRLLLGPKTTVTEVGPYTDWEPLFHFDPAAALERLRAQPPPTPLDLAAETLEEVVVAEPKLGAEPLRVSEGRRVLPLTGRGGLALDVLIPDNPYDKDGEETLTRMRAALRAGTPLLYGLVYYEYCRLLFLPLSVLPTGSKTEPAEEPAAPKKGAAPKPAKPAKPAKSAKGGAGAAERTGPDLFTISDKSYDVSALVGKLF